MGRSLRGFGADLDLFRWAAVGGDSEDNFPPPESRKKAGTE